MRPTPTNIHYDSGSDIIPEKNSELPYISSILQEVKILLNEKFEEYEFQIFASNKHTNIIPINKEKKNILIFIFNSFDFNILNLESKYFLILKSFLKNYGTKKLIGIPVGSPLLDNINPNTPILKRRYNYSFIGTYHTYLAPFFIQFCELKYLPQPLAISALSNKKIRHFFEKKIHRKQKEKGAFILFSNEGLSDAIQADIICQSKIILCPKGENSAETAQHIQALKAGSILISDPLPDHDFYQSDCIIQVENWNDLLSMLPLILKNENQMENLHMDSKQLFKQYLDPKAIAQKIAALLKF